MPADFSTLHGLSVVLIRCVASQTTHGTRIVHPDVSLPMARELDDLQLQTELRLLGRADLAADPEALAAAAHGTLRARCFLWFDQGGMGLPEVARTCLVANVASIMLVGPRIYKLTAWRTRHQTR